MVIEGAFRCGGYGDAGQGRRRNGHGGTAGNVGIAGSADSVVDGVGAHIGESGIFAAPCLPFPGAIGDCSVFGAGHRDGNAVGTAVIDTAVAGSGGFDTAGFDAEGIGAGEGRVVCPCPDGIVHGILAHLRECGNFTVSLPAAGIRHLCIGGKQAAHRGGGMGAAVVGCRFVGGDVKDDVCRADGQLDAAGFCGIPRRRHLIIEGIFIGFRFGGNLRQVIGTPGFAVPDDGAGSGAGNRREGVGLAVINRLRICGGNIQVVPQGNGDLRFAVAGAGNVALPEGVVLLQRPGAVGIAEGEASDGFLPLHFGGKDKHPQNRRQRFPVGGGMIIGVAAAICGIPALRRRFQCKFIAFITQSGGGKLKIAALCLYGNADVLTGGDSCFVGLHVDGEGGSRRIKGNHRDRFPISVRGINDGLLICRLLGAVPGVQKRTGIVSGNLNFGHRHGTHGHGLLVNLHQQVAEFSVLLDAGAGAHHVCYFQIAI